jgi:uncharacterized protein (DUF433 family)
MIPHPHVILDSAGSPMVVGSNVPVRRIWEGHKRGVSIDILFKRYSTIGPAKLLDALSFAYDNQEMMAADRT